MEISNKKFHFIAIGGVGMSALAKYLAEHGAVVSGSDIAESKYTHLLETIGVKVYIGHNSELISQDMIVVSSSAIKEDNPEIIKAKELGLKINHRSDILKMISDEFHSRKEACFIGYSGTHGKTTTSGLASYVLEKAGYSPSYVVGGIIPEANTNGKYAGNTLFVSELDESDGTIEKYSTDIAVINNMEEDHLDHYTNGFSDIAKTFNKFLSNNTTQKVVINADNEGNKKFMELYPSFNFITFGVSNGLYQAKNIKIEGLTSSFDIFKKDSFISDIKLSVLGIHNVYNALAVVVSLIEAGIDINKIKSHFQSFSGMGRRFQRVGEYNGIKIYDDYAHHPSEIKTTLNSLKDAVGNKNRIVAVFQPHRYSRLKSLWNEFKNSFNSADLLIVTDVFAAGEQKIENVTGQEFAAEINKDFVMYLNGDIKDVASALSHYLKSGDIVVSLGAGTITNLGKYLLENSQVRA